MELLQRVTDGGKPFRVELAILGGGMELIYERRAAVIDHRPGHNMLALSACGQQPTSEADDAPEPAAFDLTLVRANFAAECEAPIVVDDLFCEQVDLDGMTAEGTILRVPTTLNAEARDRAQVICATIARVHFDGDTGEDLGYETVGILDRDGGNAAACSV